MLQLDGAHTLGATAVSWAPAEPKGSLVSGKPPGQPVKRFVSGGCDNAVKVWAPTVSDPHAVHRNSLGPNSPDATPSSSQPRPQPRLDHAAVVPLVYANHEGR